MSAPTSESYGGVQRGRKLLEIVARALVVMILSLRFMSLASMVAAIAIPSTTLILGLAGESTQTPSGSVLPQTITGLVIAFMVVWRHRSNLKRILDGTEPKVFGSKRGQRDE